MTVQQKKRVNRIDRAFEALRVKGRKALIPFITAGDPDLETTKVVALAMAEAGADIIELGVPFSDPMADGPVIQAASERALAGGTTLHQILKLVKDLRKETDVPLLLMGYANPIFAMGLEAFADAASEAGLDAVLTVDLPPEEAHSYCQTLAGRDLRAIFLLAPTSGTDRLKQVDRVASGFVYYVSLTGVTGAKLAMESDFGEHLAEVRPHLRVPVCVGFGIHSPEQAKKVVALADGVVIGSALVSHLAAIKGKTKKAKAAGEFIKKFRKVL